MTQIVDLVAFTASGAFWGGIIGPIITFIVMLFVFTVVEGASIVIVLCYGGFCGVGVSVIPALIIGAVNGWICGLVTRYYDDPLRDPADYLSTLRTTGLNVGIVIGGVLVAFSLFATMDGSIFMFMVIIFGVIVATCVYSAIRIAQDHLNDLQKNGVKTSE